MACQTSFLLLEHCEIDHILPLDLGGSDDDTNLQALCVPCHKIKTREDIKRIAKARRIRACEDGSRRSRKAIPSAPFPPSRSLGGGKMKRKMDGSVVSRD